MGLEPGTVGHKPGNCRWILRAAAVACLGIPVQGDTAVLAAYPFILFLAPLVDTQLLLAADVLENLRVVRDAVIAELDDEAAGGARAIGAPGDAGFCYGAPPNLAVRTRWTERPLAEAAFTGDLVRGNVPPLSHLLEKPFESLPVLVMPGAIYSACPAVESTDTAEMFAFHNDFSLQYCRCIWLS